MSLKSAIRLIRSTYISAIHNPHISNPLAYSLYYVWRVVDSEDTEAMEEGHE